MEDAIIKNRTNRIESKKSPLSKNILIESVTLTSQYFKVMPNMFCFVVKIRNTNPKTKPAKDIIINTKLLYNLYVLLILKIFNINIQLIINILN